MARTGASSTAVVELIELQQPAPSKQTKPRISESESRRRPSIGGHSLGKTISNQQETASSDPSNSDRNETLPSPTTAPNEPAETWRTPRINLYRLPATFWAFVIMGMNDATYGAIIPYLETYYDLSYIIVSLIFLSPFVGYNLSAVLNNHVHLKLGQRGVAFIGPFSHVIAYIIIAVHPPYPVLVIAFMLAGFGNGIEDAGWNAWIGVMQNANEMLGFLHAFYGAGATVAPLIATTMITQAGLQWYTWYYCMVGFSVVELATSLHAFWAATGAVYREQNPRTGDHKGGRLSEACLKLPAARTTWLAALFLLGYVGIEVALGGWIVTFMIQVRDGAAFASGMTATGFWLGITVGRVVLGFVTPRIGEKLAVAVSPLTHFPLFIATLAPTTHN